MNERNEWNLSAATLLLRLVLGVLFLLAGIRKLGDPGPFAEHIHSQFDATWLGGPLLTLFVWMLPGVEVLVGALLLLGWLTPWAALAAGLTLVVLFLGKLTVKDGATCAQIALYLLLTSLVLRAPADNRFSVDELIRRARQRK